MGKEQVDHPDYGDDLTGTYTSTVYFKRVQYIVGQ
jgi:hypothetical protein